jgi:hydrogenase maturation factor
VGEDACAIELPAGTLVASTDPITFTAVEAGALAVAVGANDVAVTGARPRWFLATVLLPPGTGEDALRELFGGLQRALADVGAHLVGGHTEVTPAVSRPVVVGQMLGLVEHALVSSGGARVGDVVIQIGPVPVEGAAVLAAEAAGEVLDGLDGATLAAARGALRNPGISVVEPALLAARLGASALHDPTEGGLAGGLHELAYASGVRLRVDEGAVLWFEPGLALCRAVGADPWATLASGAVVAAFAAGRAEAALAGLAERGFAAARIGAVEPGAGLVGREGAIAWPDRDEVARLLAERRNP